MRAAFFGAFDRHNLGDILLAHVAAHGTDTPCFAGLAARDLAMWSGQHVAQLASITQPVRLVHVGGELLDCDAAQAAYMLGEPMLRWSRRAPYVVACNALPAGSETVFRAIGGVGLAARDDAFRNEVAAALRQATSVSVRDRVTQHTLAQLGIDAPLEPDPVTRIVDLFGNRIRGCAPRRAPYVAVQFAAECGDDRTLAAIAAGLDRIGLPVVMFRAGAASRHDDLEPYRRLAARVHVQAAVFESLDVWDICGLIAASRFFVGTSLHGRIVAESCGVAAVTLDSGSGSAAKVRAYLDTWHPQSSIVTTGAFAGTADRCLAR